MKQDKTTLLRRVTTSSYSYYIVIFSGDEDDKDYDLNPLGGTRSSELEGMMLSSKKIYKNVQLGQDLKLYTEIGHNQHPHHNFFCRKHTVCLKS